MQSSSSTAHRSHDWDWVTATCGGGNLLQFDWLASICCASTVLRRRLLQRVLHFPAHKWPQENRFKHQGSPQVGLLRVCMMQSFQAKAIPKTSLSQRYGANS